MFFCANSSNACKNMSRASPARETARNLLRLALNFGPSEHHVTQLGNVAHILNAQDGTLYVDINKELLAVGAGRRALADAIAHGAATYESNAAALQLSIESTGSVVHKLQALDAIADVLGDALAHSGENEYGMLSKTSIIRAVTSDSLKTDATFYELGRDRVSFAQIKYVLQHASALTSFSIQSPAVQMLATENTDAAFIVRSKIDNKTQARQTKSRKAAIDDAFLELAAHRVREFNVQIEFVFAGELDAQFGSLLSKLY